MPTYQYACTGCDERFERVQAFTDPTLTVHEPGCGAPVRKLFGSVGVVFKGTGFYRNDSRGSTTSSESGGTSSDSGTSTSSGSESSPAKTESAPTAAAPAKTESKPAASTSTSSTSSSTSAA